MKALLLALGCALLSLGSAMAQSTDTSSIVDPALRRELLEMVEADQSIRHALIESGMANPDDSLLSVLAGIDSVNTARIKEIIREYGWPGPDLVGRDGSEAAFLLVQHADRDRAFQKEVLPLVKQAYEAGTLSGQSYALLLDRVLVGEGRPQVYGTQMRPFEENREPMPYPIEDERNVDQRRAEVGLPPLAEYLHLIKQMYFPQDQ